jgi:aquaporin Z
MSDFIKYGVEFLGTFLFLSVILSTGNPISIAVALLAMIYFGGSISGGHFNPAVTSMFFAKGDISSIDTIMYIVAQILGGLCAYLFYDKVVRNYKK